MNRYYFAMYSCTIIYMLTLLTHIDVRSDIKCIITLYNYEYDMYLRWSSSIGLIAQIVIHSRYPVVPFYELNKDIPSSSERAGYGVSFANSQAEQSFSFLPLVLCSISCFIRPPYIASLKYLLYWGCHLFEVCWMTICWIYLRLYALIVLWVIFKISRCDQVINIRPLLVPNILR